MLRETAGKGATEDWKNFIVRRSLRVPTFLPADEGSKVDIKPQEGEVVLKGRTGVAASKRRLVDWGVRDPPPLTGATVVSVAEVVYGRVVVMDSTGKEHAFDNPVGGLVNDVLGYMTFGSSNKQLSRQDFFKPTSVTFEGESGVDVAGEGGLTTELFQLFWRGVIKEEVGLDKEEVGLFETRDRALPLPGSNKDRLELVGRFLCKSIINSQPIGQTLARFALEFIIGDAVRTFDDSLDIGEQVCRALKALDDYDSKLQQQWKGVLDDLLEKGLKSVYNGAFAVEIFAPNREDKDAPVTASNAQEVIVAGCRYILWEKREQQLKALRAGFRTEEAITERPIDLSDQLKPFLTPELAVLVQGTAGVSKAELLDECIEWPSDGGELGGFPSGSITCALLRELFEDEDVWPAAHERSAFLVWATSSPVIPAGGFANTNNSKGKIQLKYMASCETDERRMPLPRATTCFHLMHLPNYSSRDVLKQKLERAVAHRDDGFAEMVD